MAKVLENYKKTNFSSKSQPGACLAVCLIFWPISAWRAYKLRAYKKKVCIEEITFSYFKKKSRLNMPIYPAIGCVLYTTFFISTQFISTPG